MMSNETTDMENLRYWAEGKDGLVGRMALFFASFEEDFFELFKEVKRGYRIEDDIRMPSLTSWLNMYRHHDKVVSGLFEALYRIKNLSEEELVAIKEASRAEKELKKMSDAEKDYVNHVFEQTSSEEWEELNKNINERIRSIRESREKRIVTSNRDKKDEKSEEKKKRFKNNPQVIFFFRVLFPCFSIYGVFPIDLLRRARSGDTAALEKLIRLDKSAIFDPKISKIVHKAQGEKKQARMYAIKKAFGSTPKVITNRKKIRSCLAGLISLFSIRLKKKLPAIQIYKLFNALDLDMGRRGTDPEIFEIKKTDEKTVKHYRKFWSGIIPVG
jgi:hypothetical protein